MGVDWRGRALCRETDPELFFPEKGGSVREAKWVCARCPVREACLEDSLATGDVFFGIRGGLSARNREAMARRRGLDVDEDDYDAGLVDKVIGAGHRPADVYRIPHREADVIVRRLVEAGMSRHDIEILYGLNTGRHRGVSRDVGRIA